MMRPMGQLLQVLLDMSCGSGLFSRRFAASRRFSGVIAADYSESMLRQVQQNFESSGFVNDGCASLKCHRYRCLSSCQRKNFLQRLRAAEVERRQEYCCRNTSPCCDPCCD